MDIELTPVSYRFANNDLLTLNDRGKWNIIRKNKWMATASGNFIRLPSANDLPINNDLVDFDTVDEAKQVWMTSHLHPAPENPELDQLASYFNVLFSTCPQLASVECRFEV